MKENDNSKMQYNSCSAKGICSVNPRISALQRVLGLYISLYSKYGLKLLDKGALEKTCADFILNISAIAVANPEFTEYTFIKIISELRKILPTIINKYNKIYGESSISGEDILSSEIFQKSADIIEAIKLGENYIKKNIEILPAKTFNLYKVVYIIAKSLSINLLNIKSFGSEDEEAFKNILKTFSSVYEKISNEKLKKLIESASEENIRLMCKLHNLQEERYGIQGIANVSYTTTPAKAILVVGTNIRELETILDSVQNTDINVYTHDDMMLAHTFPKFSEYTNLKGQFGHGIENCLIDFATFPGPIIFTKYSLANAENLYRGRLFTTDMNYCKGIVKIENDDFSEVIKTANSTKGFKTGKVCETVTTGYDYQICINKIQEKIESKLYKNIAIIGLKSDTFENKEYFIKLLKHFDKSTLIVSFSYNSDADNFIHINACFDPFAVLRFLPLLVETNLPIGIFVPHCDRNTLSKVIYFSKFSNIKFFLGKCQPILINPALKSTLTDVFKIDEMTSSKSDYEKFFEFCNTYNF